MPFGADGSPAGPGLQAADVLGVQLALLRVDEEGKQAVLQLLRKWHVAPWQHVSSRPSPPPPGRDGANGSAINSRSVRWTGRLIRLHCNDPINGDCAGGGRVYPRDLAARFAAPHTKGL
jgi:hypothetical protein